MENIKNWIKKEYQYIGIAVGLGFLLLFTIGFIEGTRAYSETMVNGIADSVLRFHIRANSNSEQDQMLKLKTRDEVLTYINNEFGEDFKSNSLEESLELVENNLESIKGKAEEFLQKQGFNYTVKASVDYILFPYKEYGSASFPPGYYHSLVLEIGEGVGENWWCLMYPPLCFVDITQGELAPESVEELSKRLTPEEYELIMESKNQLKPMIKFKIVEWWQERKQGDV